MGVAAAALLFPLLHPVEEFEVLLLWLEDEEDVNEEDEEQDAVVAVPGDETGAFEVLVDCLVCSRRALRRRASFGLYT